MDAPLNPYDYLCWYDPRYTDFITPEDDREDYVHRQPRDNCSCDNCHYGRDALALEIIRLKEGLGT